MVVSATINVDLIKDAHKMIKNIQFHSISVSTRSFLWQLCSQPLISRALTIIPL